MDMRKYRFLLGIIGALGLAACAQEHTTSSPEAPPVSSTQMVSPSPSATPSATSWWYDRLLTDESYSIQDALRDYPEKRGDFGGEIVFDRLLTGSFTHSFDRPVPAGQAVKMTMICRSDTGWESTLSPAHDEFFAAANSCRGHSSFTSRPSAEDIPSWLLDIRPESEDLTYRVILEIVGQ